MSVCVVTTDLYESSYLACVGARLAEVRVDRGRLKSTVVFVFEGDGRLSELQRSYHRGTATVNLAEFRASLTRLRRTMYARLSNQRNPCHDPIEACAAVP